MSTMSEINARLSAPGSLFEIVDTEGQHGPVQAWRQAPATMNELFERCARFGDREFIVFDDERSTYAQFRDRVRALKTYLKSSGLKKGDRVALLMSNIPEWPTAFFAVTLLGALAVPINTAWTATEIDHVLTDSGTRLVIAEDSEIEKLAPILAARAAGDDISVIRCRASTPGSHPLFDDLIAEPPESADDALEDLAPFDDLAIFYTSGTAGRPKGAVISHFAAMNSIITFFVPRARALLLAGGKIDTSDTAPQEVAIIILPMFHIAGCCSLLLPACFKGDKAVLMKTWEADKALQLAREEQIFALSGVPFMVKQLLSAQASANYDLPDLKAIHYGGGPSPSSVIKEIKAVFPTVAPATSWGMTETASVTVGVIGAEYEARPNTCGLPSPVHQLKVVGPDGQPLPSGEAGELLIKGPQLFSRYWNNEEATGAALTGGWLRTGDVATIDEEGYLYIVDRLKDMIICAGKKIFSTEVEDALQRHPAVYEAAVVGRAHPQLGEEPVAAVYSDIHPRPTARELKTYLRGELAIYKIPVDIVFLDAPLPRNAVGKVTKRFLSDHFS